MLTTNALRTVVYQSYRTHDVADWLQRCMRSTRSWAQTQGYDYRFIDDRFFEFVPDWYRRAAGGNVQVVTNLARIAVAKALLAEGYERTIWVDADVLVFDPPSFRIDVDSEFAFCREIWTTMRWGSPIKVFRVNNSVMVFVKNNSFIDFAIWAHEDLVRRGTQILPHGTTTRLLTALHLATPLPLLTNVGLLGPVVARDITDRDGRLAREYATAHGTPMRAAKSRRFAARRGIERDHAGRPGLRVHRRCARAEPGRDIQRRVCRLTPAAVVSPRRPASRARSESPCTAVLPRCPARVASRNAS